MIRIGGFLITSWTGTLNRSAKARALVSSRRHSEPRPRYLPRNGVASSHAALFKYLSAQYYGPVDMVGLYWHLVDLIWIYLFPLMYLIS